MRQRMGMLPLAGRPRLWARNSHGRRSMMKAATGLPSGVPLPAVAFPVHVVAGLAAAGLGSRVASRHSNARLVFRQDGRDPPAGRATGGNRGRPICRYRVQGITFESCSSGKLSCRQYTSTERTNGVPSRRGTQTSLPGSVEPGTSTAVCPSRPGYHTPGTISPSRFDSAYGRSGPGSPTTRNATSCTTALRLTCSSGGSPTCSAPGPRSRSSSRRHDRGAARDHPSPAPVLHSAQARASRRRSLVVNVPWLS